MPKPLRIQYPNAWYYLFKGDRINDHHLTLEEKRQARAKASARKGDDA